jgi:hypothetical protein
VGGGFCIKQLLVLQEELLAQFPSNPGVIKLWVMTPQTKGRGYIFKNFAPGMVVELEFFSISILTNQFPICFLLLVEAQGFFERPTILYSFYYYQSIFMLQNFDVKEASLYSLLFILQNVKIFPLF